MLSLRLVLIASLERAQNREMRIFQAHHLIEAEDALGVVAQRQGARDDPDLAGARPEEAPDQRSGRPAGGDVVDADVVMPTGAGNVGHESDDMGSAGDQIVDRGAHALMVEGHDGDAVVPSGQGFEGICQNLRVEDVNRDRLDAGAPGAEPTRHAADVGARSPA